MKHTLAVILLSFIHTAFLFSQVVLTIEGEEIIDTETGTSDGYNIPRSEPTILTFRNNILNYFNASGYMLQAGDETPGDDNNNLDGEVITGNRFVWDGTDEDSWTHSVFTGYNIDVIIKYNYLENTPNGIQRKSNGMTDESGVIAYNIIKNPKVGIVVKGINGIRIFNNTLYSEKTSAQTYRALIDIHTNTDGGLNAPSTGTKIYNNIFYTRNSILSIWIYETACLEDFESDYNIFWCESGEPVFRVEDSYKSFSQWQAMGYDQHSIVINPEFKDFKEFIPLERLDYGTDLGADFQEGLAIDATWERNEIRTTDQNGTWQVGARIYEEEEEEEELPQNVTLIYPNPARGYINIILTNSERIYQAMSLYDSKGSIVFTEPIYYGKNTIEIPAKLKSGLYTIALNGSNLEQYVQKLIILH